MSGKIPESTGIARYNSQFCHSFAVRNDSELEKKKEEQRYISHITKIEIQQYQTATTTIKTKLNKHAELTDSKSTTTTATKTTTITII